MINLILKNFTTITPTRRFFFFYKTYLNAKLSQVFLYKLISRNNALKNSFYHLKSTHIKTKQKYPTVLLKYQTLKTISSILTNFYLLPNKRKLLSEFITIYSTYYITWALDMHYAGFKFFQKEIRPNHSMCLLDVPYYSSISLITTQNFKTPTFCKSAGSIATKLLSDKKSKFVLVELPSLKKIFLENKNLCLLGTLFNLKLELHWDGKFSNKKNKKIHVRGVAMNPVDHPNGGRTKAKQPELSPWGWVAKHNK